MSTKNVANSVSLKPAQAVVLAVAGLMASTLPGCAEKHAPGDRIASSKTSPGELVTETNPVGTLPGSAGVTAGGAATYQIPIDVPRGRAGIEPSLAISYSSGAGAGALGIGFALEGIQSIQRCPLDPVHPDVVHDDAVDLCFGGRLLLTEGTHEQDGAVYRVHGQPGLRIGLVVAKDTEQKSATYGDDILHFVVSYPDGKTGIFGSTNEAVSWAPVPSSLNNRRVGWYIRWLEDEFGNRMRYDYEGAAELRGSRLPTHISYTYSFAIGGDYDAIDFGSRVISFQYEARDSADTYDGYRAMSLGTVSTTKRLAAIEAKVNGELAHRYEFTYQNDSTSKRTLLSEISKCDAEGVCLPPTTFDWELGAGGYEPVELAEQAANTAPNFRDIAASVHMDADNDGKTELVFAYDSYRESNGAHWNVWDPEVGIKPTPVAARFMEGNAALAPVAADFNGDGLVDIVSPFCTDEDCTDSSLDPMAYTYANSIHVVLGDASDPDGIAEWGDGEVASTDDRIFAAHVAEIDGDGYPDMFVCRGTTASGLASSERGGYDHTAFWHLMLNRSADNNGVGRKLVSVQTLRRCFATELYQVMDADGDGRDELWVPGINTARFHQGTYNSVADDDEGYDLGIDGLGFFTYFGLELPQYAEDGARLSIDGAIDLVQSATEVTGWPAEGKVSHELPIDFSQRILAGCHRPDEDAMPAALESQIADAVGAGQASELAADFHAPSNPFLDGLIPNWLDDDDMFVFPVPPTESRIPANVPFVRAGAGPDRKVDINGDGRVDLVRMTAIDGDGEPIVVFDQVHAAWPAYCLADKQFDFGFELFINNGETFVAAGTIKLLESVEPFRAAKMLALVVPIDYNSDGRTDWLSPDFGKFFADIDGELSFGGDGSAGATDQWEILLAQVTADPAKPIDYVELDLIVDHPWYDATHELSNIAQHHLRELFRKHGLSWSSEVSANEFPDLVSRAITAIHLSDKLLQDILFFAGTESGRAITAGAKAGHRPDYLTRVTDGLGKKTEWDYTTGFDRNVYQPYAATPTAARYTPSMVVSEQRLDAGLEQDRWLHRTFEYGGAYVDRRGLGSLGTVRTVTHERTSGESEPEKVTRFERDRSTEYDPIERAYPFAGRVTRSVTDTKFESAGTPRRFVRQTLNTWQLVDAAHQNFTVGLANSAAASFDLHGGPSGCAPFPCSQDRLANETALSSIVSTTSSFDAFGNVLDQSIDRGAGFVTTTKRDVANYGDNDDDPYAVGLEERLTVTDATPNGTATRVVASAYQPSTLALDVTTREPDDEGGPMWRQTKYGRGIRGNLTSVETSASGGVRITETSWGTDGYFPSTTTNALGHTTETHWLERLDAPVKVADPNGHVTETCVDGLGRPSCTRVRDSLLGPSNGEHFTFSIQSAPAPFAGEAAYEFTTRRNGSVVSRRAFDRLKRTKRVTSIVFDPNDPSGTPYHRLTRYDELGRVINVTNPLTADDAAENAPATHYQYDRLGRELRRINANGSEARRHHVGLQITVTDEESDVVKFEHDAAGHLIRRIEGSAETCFDYAAFGTLRAARRNCAEVDRLPERKTAQWFDSWNRRERLQDPELGNRIELWDGFDERVEMVDGTGASTLYDYDAVGRLTHRTSDDGVAQWIYDIHSNGVGKLARTENEDDTVVREMHYDNFGRPTELVTDVEGDSFTVAMSYANNRVRTVDYPAIPFLGNSIEYRVRYDYDQAGNVTAVIDDQTNAFIWQLVAMDGWQHVTDELASVNGVLTQRTFYPLSGRQSSDSVSHDDAGVIVSRSYTWTGDGNLEVLKDNVTGDTRTFVYDSRDQLRKTLVGGTEVASVSYDVYGGITDKTDVGAYTYESGTGRLKTAGGQTFQHDANGNVHTKLVGSSSTTLARNALGKVASASVGRTSVSFAYDADGTEVLKRMPSGRRVVSAGPMFQYRSGGGEQAEYRYSVTAGSRVVAQVTRRVALGLPTTLRYTHTDYRGSVLATTDDSGEIVTLDYDPWGARLDGPSDPFALEDVNVGFTGHDSEPVAGLIDMRARYYDPKVGRFMGADTIVPNPVVSLDWNRYAYVRNNPLRWIDPTGHGPAAPSEPDDRGGDGGGGGPSDDVGNGPEGPYDPSEGTCPVNGETGPCDDYRDGLPLPSLPADGVTGSSGVDTDARTAGTDDPSDDEIIIFDDEPATRGDDDELFVVITEVEDDPMTEAWKATAALNLHSLKVVESIKQAEEAAASVEPPSGNTVSLSFTQKVEFAIVGGLGFVLSVGMDPSLKADGTLGGSGFINLKTPAGDLKARFHDATFMERLGRSPVIQPGKM